tara:strand:- start:5785 stop:8343 length:2559 start_codon:yes stop_codon:yes gene_type:complete
MLVKKSPWKALELSMRFTLMQAFLLFVISSLCSLSSFSSTVTPISSIHVENSDTQDIVIVNKPNTNGLSINKFISFQIDRPLKLINLAKEQDGEPQAAADLIVIQADNLSVLHNITLLGPAADLLLVLKGSGKTLQCNGCSFENFNRVTLATVATSFDLSESDSQVGVLQPIAGQAIELRSVESPGVLAFEAVSREISFAVDINTHTRVKQSSLGGYEKDINGNLTMGGGSVNLVLGNNQWNYESQSVVKAMDSSIEPNISGNIISSAVKISHSGRLNSSISINTRSDLLSVVRYQGQQQMTGESVTIQSLRDSLTVDASIQSNGSVTLQSGKLLSISDSASVTSPMVNIYSRNDIHNLGVVQTDHLGVAGGFILNRGRLEAFETAELYADNNIVNNFGGIIVAPDLAIESANGIFRNGSRYPYVSENHNYSDLFALDTVEEIYESVGMGAYYRSDIFEEDLTKRNKPDSTQAVVVGESLRIKAAAIENLNPYWVPYNSDGSYTIDKRYMSQVMIGGLKSLEVEAVNYILNSSAVMKVDDVLGTMTIKSPVITNERYRSLNLLEKEQITLVEESNGVQTTSETTSFYTKAYSFSPPGLILSMGQLQLEAQTGFINNQAYFEVYGAAYLNSSTIRDIGLEHNGILGIESSDYLTDCDGINQLISRSAMVILLKRYCKQYTADSEGRTITLPAGDEADSLFLVHGDVYGNQAWFDSYNRSPFEQYVDMVVDEVMDRDFSEYGEEGEVTGEVTSEFTTCPSYGWCMPARIDSWTVTSTNFDTQTTGDQLLISASVTETGYSSSAWTPYIINEGDSNVINLEDQEYSIIDELLKLWDELVNWFSGLLSDLNWWSEE